MSNGVNQCAACGGLWGDDEPHVACPSDHPSDPTDKAVALLKTIGLDITYTDEGLRLKTAEEIRAEARADVFRVFNSDPGKHSITNEQHVLFCAECHALRHLYEQGKRDAAAPRTLTADDPEPAVGSVVLDGNGRAWQRTYVHAWCTYGVGGWTDWESMLRLFAPFTLIHDGEAGR